MTITKYLICLIGLFAAQLCAQDVSTWRAEQEKEVAKRVAWHRRTMVDAYQKLGRKNPKWDKDVLEVLEASVLICANDPKRPADTEAKVLAAGAKAAQAGCDDPLYQYMYLTVLARQDRNEAMRLCGLAAAGMEKSQYPALRKAYALNENVFMLANTNRKDAERMLDASLALLPEIIKDKELPRDAAIELAGAYLTALKVFNTDVKPGFEKIHAQLTRNYGNHVIPHMVAARFHLAAAMDVRGQKSDAQLTPGEKDDINARLEKSEQALNAAWKADPTASDVAVEMLSLAVNRNAPADNIELWFRRAMDTNPDNYLACRLKMEALHRAGNKDALLAFGRECLAGGNFKGRIPVILMEIHNLYSQQLEPGENPKIIGMKNGRKVLARAQERVMPYYRAPKVWADVKAVYDGILAVSPDSHRDRSHYALYACFAEQWAEADKQFKLLGSNAHLDIFHGAAKFEKWKAQAAEQAGKK